MFIPTSTDSPRKKKFRTELVFPKSEPAPKAVQSDDSDDEEVDDDLLMAKLTGKPLKKKMVKSSSSFYTVEDEQALIDDLSALLKHEKVAEISRFL